MWQNWTPSFLITTYSIWRRNNICKLATSQSFVFRGGSLSSLQRILSCLFQYIAIISGAAFGVVSMAIILFALTVNAQAVRPESEPFNDDNFVRFVENLTYYTNIQILEAQGLTKGNANFEPWSGSYWPIHKGILGNRYSSRTFARSKSFINNYESFKAHPAENFLTAGKMSELSPAEKYDLLIGDTSWSLTRYMWGRGLEDYQRDGVVAGWTGICHGWAGASHINPVATYYPVTVLDITGRYNITFHANDIKALLSWLWADASPSSYRAGNRCRQSKIDRDPYLRPVDPTCLDSNPMSWHLAVVNKVGLNKKSMVMDSSNGSEVWNYPITGYDYSYFDPKTFVTTHSFKDAIRPVHSLTSDVYKKFRSTKAQYIVGIIMDTYHPSLTEPTTGVTSRISTKRKTFIYDLELDESYNVVGGEWYAKETPDFIWGFPEGSLASTREDNRLKSQNISWNAKAEPLSPTIASLAREATKRGAILSTITNAFLAASTKSEFPTNPPQQDEADEEEIEEDSTDENNNP